MKKFVCLAVAVAVLGAAGLSTATAVEPNTGCGLGSQVFPVQDTIIKQVFAATTNGTFGNQTFGISSGTLNCQKPAKWTSNERLEPFVAANMDTLARDIAAGEGETLSTLAELLQIPAAQRPSFAATLKANFTKIYPSPLVQAGAVIDAIIGVIS